ncbi:MAG TPA: hypothetical protein VLA34_02385, partial [Candidatus Krumholzibacterium sp.]|nr:hypothetical protein [Candidatus Krumholzibacterium sp.]
MRNAHGRIRLLTATAVALALACPAGARAQTRANPAASSASQAPADSSHGPWMGVTSDTKVDFTEGYQQVSSGLIWNYLAWGWVYNASMNVSKKQLRGRDMDMISENGTASAAKVVPGSYMTSLNFGDTYSKQTSVSLSQYGKDIIMETASAGITYKMMRPILFADGTELGVSGEASQGQQDFKYNRTFKAEAGAHFRYLIGDAIKLKGGYGTHQKREGSDVGPIEFRGVRSHADTLSAGLDLGRGESKFIKLRYSRRVGNLRQVDPPFGNSMQIIDNPEEARIEENQMMADQLSLDTKIRPLERVSVDVSFSRSYSDNKFLIEDRRNKETETNALSAGVTYKYRTGGSLGVSMDRNESDNEYGPTSVASFRTKGYSLTATLSESIHDSLSIMLRGTLSLDQKFFKKKEQNPRDADYTFASLYGKVDTWMFGFIKTIVTGTMSRHETINIDASLSGDNRTDYQYYFIPEFSFNPTPYMSLGQKYELKVDYTEFSFDSNQNYLNRNTTLVTNAGFNLFRRMRLRLEHRYNMKDTGSYLSSAGADRLYGPTNENIENKLQVVMEYDPVEDLTIFVRSSFKGQKNNALSFSGGTRRIVGTSATESGDLRV